MEAVAWDWTGHGRSARLPGQGAAAERFVWARVGPDDLQDVISTVKASARAPSKVYGVGHSFGASAMALSETACPGTFDGIVMLEPIIRRRKIEGETHPLVDKTLRRRALFEDTRFNDLVARFADAFGTWDRRAVEGYVRRGFREVNRATADSGLGRSTFELECKPDVEASVYLGAMECDVYSALGEIGCPVIMAVGEDSCVLDANSAVNLDKYESFRKRCRRPLLPLQVAPACGHAIPSTWGGLERPRRRPGTRA